MKSQVTSVLTSHHHTPIGVVVDAKGTIKAVLPDGTIRILQAGDLVYKEDTIHVDKNALCRLVTYDGQWLDFTQNTTPENINSLWGNGEHPHLLDLSHLQTAISNGMDYNQIKQQIVTDYNSLNDKEIYNEGGFHAYYNFYLDPRGSINPGFATDPINSEIKKLDLKTYPLSEQDQSIVDPQDTDLVIDKTVNNATPDMGNTITYTLAITNEGHDTAQHVVVTDVLPEGLTIDVSSITQGGVYDAASRTITWEFSHLDSQADKTLTYSVVITSNAALENLLNTAHVASDTFDTNLTNNTDTQVVDVQATDVDVVKTVDNHAPDVNDVITYTINVNNQGEDVAQQVTVVDTLPEGLTVDISSITQGGIYNAANNTITWHFDSLAVNTNIVLTYQTTVTAQANPESTLNTVTVNSQTHDVNLINNTDTEIVDPQDTDLVISKGVNDITPNVGDNIQYSITVTNIGNDTAQHVVVTDILPPELEVDESSIGSNGSYDHTTRTITWVFDNLSASSSQTLTYNVQVNNQIPPERLESILNVAHVTTDTYEVDKSNNTAQQAIDVQDADLSLVKTVSNPTPNTGEQITYTITLTNDGNDPATGVIVKDLLPDGVNFQQATVSQGSYNSTTGIWNIGNVAVGQIITLEITTLVTHTGNIINTSEIIASQVYDPDSTPNNNNPNEDDQSSVGIHAGDPAGGIFSAITLMVSEDSQPQQNIGNNNQVQVPVQFNFTPVDNEIVQQITIINIPSGVKISDGSQTIIGTGNNSITIAVGNLNNITLTQAQNDSDADYILQYQALIKDPDSNETSTHTGNINVQVDAVADKASTVESSISNLETHHDGISGFAYAIGGATAGGHDSTLYLINLSTGAATPIGEVAIPVFGSSGTNLDVEAMDLNPQNGFLYALVKSTGNEKGLIKVNPDTAETQFIGQTGGIGTLGGFAFASDGTLYAVKDNSDSKLYTIDLNTAATTVIADTGKDLGGLAIDPTDNQLYGVGKEGNQTILYQLDKTNGQVVSEFTIQGISNNTQLEGLDFDSAGNLWAVDRLSGSIYQIDVINHIAILQSTTLGNNQQTGDGFEQIVIQPAQPITCLTDHIADLQLSAHFGDVTDSSEQHYFLVEIEAGWSATSGAEVIVLGASNPYNIPAGSYVKVTADGLIDANGNVTVTTNLTAPTVTSNTNYQISVYAIAQEINLSGTETNLSNNIAVTPAGTLTVTVCNPDYHPEAIGTLGTVDESSLGLVGSLVNGSQPLNSNETVTGTLSYNFAADGANSTQPFTWSTSVVATDPEAGDPILATLTSGGDPIVWTLVNGSNGAQLVGTAVGDGPYNNQIIARVEMLNSNTGEYKFTLYGPIDHPDANQTATSDYIQLNIPFTIKDADGDTANGLLKINVNDDGPIANPQASTIEVNQTNTNLIIVLDVSGSMATNSGLTGLSRLDVAKAAINELMEQYDSRGDVRVQFVTFSTNATQLSTTWLTLDQAKDLLESQTPGGNTNYDDALIKAENAFTQPGMLTDAQNVAYFISDGEPNRPTNSAGINSTEQTAWQNFLSSHQITSYAIGIGTGITTTALEPIAYNGATNSEMPAQIVTDLSQLTGALVDTVTNSMPATGNFTSANGNVIGADQSGYVKSITIDGTTYIYNQTAGGSINASGANHGTFDTVNNVLSVTTSSGGIFSIDMDNGQYNYQAASNINNNFNETIGFTLSDNDQDTASNTLTIHMQMNDQTSIVRDDTIITNISGSGASIIIPTYALLYNDEDPDGTSVNISSVNNANSGSVLQNGTNIVFNDNNSDGGLFDYTGDSNGLSNIGTVNINRGQAGEGTLDGTGLGEILIDNNNSNIIKGYEGNDVLIGNGGNDTLDGGIGNDLIIGGQGNDIVNVGQGNDVVLYTSVLDGKDTIQNFDGNSNGGQDTLDLSNLFDSLGVAENDRAARVNVVDTNGGSNGPTWEVKVDTDGNNTYDLSVVTIQSTDPITVNQDIIVNHQNG